MVIVHRGFIDLHSHCMNNDSARLQACDGVTTQLELELGTWPVDTFLAEREAQGAVINFGSSVGHIPTRVAALTGAAIPFSVTDPCCMLETKQTSNPAHRDKADPAALDRLMKMLGDGLDQGGIGFGAGIVYTPGADHKETYELIRTVAKHGVCLFVHIRQQHSVGMEDLHEMLVNAAISGASVHICHALATGRYGGRSMWADMLSMVEGINQQGIDVSLEQYPYPCKPPNCPQTNFVLSLGLWPCVRPDLSATTKLKDLGQMG
jgi:N-acyl-D-aspartate/D-glutamate deacylase